MEKQRMSLILLICMLSALLVLPVQAAETVDSGTCGPELTWSLDEEGLLIISGRGEMEAYDGTNPAPWYPLRDSVIRVQAEAGVTLISASAFRNCTNLEQITLPDSLREIGAKAFENCTALTEMVIPDSVRLIQTSIFAGCTSLEKLTLPFVGCARKTPADKYQYPLGYLFGTNSYPGGLQTSQAFYDSSTTQVTAETFWIPESLRSVTVTGGNILYGAFTSCFNLTEIVIPEGITEIGDRAFVGCWKLQELRIPQTVTAIGNDAFGRCATLKELILPPNLTRIGAEAFRECAGMTELVLPETVTELGEMAFFNCRFTYGLMEFY